MQPGSRLVSAFSVVLDEAANVAALPNLDTLFSEGPGREIFVCAVFQDNAQVEAKWGREVAKIVYQQSRALYVLGGTKDEQWNRRIAHLSAEYERAKHSYSTGRMGAQVSTHTSVSICCVRVILPSCRVVERSWLLPVMMR